MNDERRKVGLVDVDGVLLDWRDAFIGWMHEHGFTMHMGDFGDWELDKAFPDLTEDDVRSYIKEFNQSARIGFLHGFPDAIQYVNRFRDDGYGFIAITAMGVDRYAHELRINNLRKVFGFNFDAVSFVDLGADKTTTLKNWQSSQNVKFWVEDKASNAIAGANLGITSFYLPRRPASKKMDDPRVISVSSWEDIYNQIAA